MHVAPQVQPLTPTIGAEVRGIDLRRGIEDEIAMVKGALCSHHVVVIRDQQLDDSALHAFAQCFGEVAPSPVGYAKDTSVDGVYDIDGAAFRASMWHTDLTFEASPSWLGILAAESVPAVGGDTVWVNMAAAYASLSRPFAAFLATLEAEHTSAGLGPMGGPLVASLHPVVASRPLTAEPVLYVNPLWTQRIVGLERRESEALLSMLHEVAVTTPEIGLRHRWSPGDVVVWDMRSTLHRAVDDYGDATRILRRASVLHDPPNRFHPPADDGRRP